MVGFEPISVSALMGYPFQLESTFVIFTFQTFFPTFLLCCCFASVQNFSAERREKRRERERARESGRERERKKKLFFEMEVNGLQQVGGDDQKNVQLQSASSVSILM